MDIVVTSVSFGRSVYLHAPFANGLFAGGFTGPAGGTVSQSGIGCAAGHGTKVSPDDVR